ncbi:DUF3231 family protein [Lentibacillus sp. N15]|uniref:DUF3231 family protein n=1 Tax=Lentibacillus songyuanensis TaxID=3136161 RepID=UPI0031BAC219
MVNQPKMSAAELGALWMTYQKKTMILRFLEYFIEKADDQKAKDLMESLWDEINPMVIELRSMLENDGAACPTGFTKEDVNLNTPQLYDNGFDIMFCRILKEISMGMYVLHMTTAYREDIVQFYKQLTSITQAYYHHFTQYLLDNGFLPRPNFTVMPVSTDYITNKDYVKGTNLFGEKRVLNTVEFGILYHTVETNITGMQLMAGFAQTAKDADVRKYFTKGRELSKEIVNETGEILLKNNIQAPATPGGTVTSSTEAPFSNKLMMFCNYQLGGFSMGGQGFSAAFILRNDVTRHTITFAKDIFEYTMEGTKLMMEKGWLEEPPKMDV